MKKALLDLIWRGLTTGALVLTIATAFASMYAPSPLAPLFHNPDPKGQENVVLYFTGVLVASSLLYMMAALLIYRAVKRSFTARNLASGKEFDESALRRDRLSAM